MSRFADSQAQEWTPLVEAAWEAWGRAYAPYSHFQVGAALLTRSGRIIRGCNVENASYGGTNCAERTAVFAAAAEGFRPGDLEALVVVTEASSLTPPCGFCRQVLAEFQEHLPVLLVNRHDRIQFDLFDLLPHAFTGRNLTGADPS